MRIKRIEVKELAHYRCNKCKHEFKIKPQSVTCQIEKCRSKYLTWLNFPDCLEYVYEKEAHEDGGRDSADAGRDSECPPKAT
jgi:DNA-directed RNA polymerase subunit RPC12/RpoP